MIYCHTCGAENENSQNYCLQDGTKLNKGKSIKLAKQTGAFCSSCGMSANTDNNYCFHCGNRFFEKKEAETAGDLLKQVPITGGSSIKLSAIPMSISSLKKISIAAVAAFVIMFAVSFLLFENQQQTLEKAFTEGLSMSGDMDLGYLLDELSIDDQTKLFNAGSYVMISHYVHPVFGIEVQEEFNKASGDIKIGIGFLMNMLIPALISLIAGIVLFRWNKERLNILKSAIVFGVVYAIILSITSFFSGQTFDAIDGGMKLEASIDHSFFAALFKGFVLSAFFAGVGMLLASNFSKAHKHQSVFSLYGNAASQAILSVFAFLIPVSIYCMYVVNKFLKSPFGFEIGDGSLIEKSFTGIASIGAQLGAYMMSLANFGTMKFVTSFKSPEDAEEAGGSFSLISGLKDHEGTSLEDSGGIFFFLNDKISDLNIALVIGVILLIVIFVWSGYRLSRKGFNLKTILAYSGIYALLLAALTKIVTLFVSGEVTAEMVEMKMEYHASIGVNAIVIFITGFIFAGIFAFAGTQLRKILGK